MGLRDFLTTRKRRLLTRIQIPMHTEALLSQIKDTVAISRHIQFEPPHLIETFFQLIDMYPLLCGLLSELQPWCGTLFWDTFGDWLIHKVNHPVPSLDSPRIGPAAHRADIKALKFATHHLWPASYWRDKHCYRCFIKEFGARPLRLSSNQCARHACQSWVRRLLEDLREQQPGFSSRSLLPQRRRSSTRRERSSMKRSARKSTRSRSSNLNRPTGPSGSTNQHQITMVATLTDPLKDEETNQEDTTSSSPRRRSSSRGSGYEMKGSTKKGWPTMDNDHATPVMFVDDAD